MMTWRPWRTFFVPDLISFFRCGFAPQMGAFFWLILSGGRYDPTITTRLLGRLLARCVAYGADERTHDQLGLSYRCLPLEAYFNAIQVGSGSIQTLGIA